MYQQHFNRIITNYGKDICNGCIYYKKTCTLFNSSHRVTDFIKSNNNNNNNNNNNPFYCKEYKSNSTRQKDKNFIVDKASP
jgi:hypothetical protein